MSQKQPPSPGPSAKEPLSAIDGSMKSQKSAKSQKSTKTQKSTKSKITAPPPVDNFGSRIGTLSLAKTAAGGQQSKLLLWSESDKVTHLSPFVFEKMARAKTMHDQSEKLIEKIRSSAQPNKAYRRERLVPSDVGAIGEREDLSITVRNSEACYDNLQPLAVYSKELAEAFHAIAGIHEIYLRQVMMYSVKPMKEYVICAYPQLLHAHEATIKSRDKYDSSRAKQKANVDERRQQLRDDASVLESFLDNLPSHQMSIAKGIDAYIRAESHYFRQVSVQLRQLRPPDNKRRWQGLNKK